MVKEEETYIKRITFYLFLCLQTITGAAFVISDHVELRSLKEEFRESKRWANDKIEASISDRAALRIELLKAGELKYILDQCQMGVKDLQERIKEHEKEVAAKN